MAMFLSVDYRERQISERLELPHNVRSLPVGDVVCDYGAGNQWIAERKTATDLARSITTGRWGEQVHRLRETGCRVIFIVEGDLRATALNYDSILGATINAELRKESFVIRTTDLAETVAVIRHLVAKGSKEPGIPPSVFPIHALSKRERLGELKTCWVRMLMCIPSVSEKIARKLLGEYGTLPAIQQALVDTKSFKRIRLDDRTCLGKERIKKLALYLTDSSEGLHEEGGHCAVEY